ncbi:DUF1080 domain-containing protein [uncultured Dokdonia sp.]|uniref:3-keto-disaccharide hydrolase n=1 Tax=uncultured Dokdonia sp. TaxID=575653 RepID=UPI002620212C|nr:DUF1080 domain-containing protein [uncultured Dokdonia sp.]
MKKLIILSVALAIFSCKNETSETKTEAVKEDTKVVEKKMEETSSEWVTLFDGTSMDQWRGYGSETMHSEWAIVDGAMAFTPGEEGGKNIITKDTYENFVLSLEWKISEAGNSGIFWGVHESPDFREAYETGPEIQVLDDAKHPDANRGGKTHRAGALYDMIAPMDNIVKPAGEWNAVILEVNHKTNLGKVTMNGTEMYTFPAHGTEWDAMVAKSKFADWKGFGKYQNGHIGLQDHSDKVWYRNIKIKRID